MEQTARIPEDSIVSMCRRLYALCGGRMEETSAYDVVAPQAGFFYARFILKAPVDGALIDAILKDAAEHGGPGLVSYTNELVGADWAEALSERGFHKLADQAGMLIELADYAPRDRDAHIERIGGDRLKEWSRVCEVSFPKPSEMPALRHWIGDEACEFYAYMEDGRIVGTLLGYAEAGNYGIHEVSTLPDCRLRGVCSALVHHALASARDAGNRYASLQASPAGTAVYERCGFRTVSTLPSWFLPQ